MLGCEWTWNYLTWHFLPKTGQDGDNKQLANTRFEEGESPTPTHQSQVATSSEVIRLQAKEEKYANSKKFRVLDFSLVINLGFDGFMIVSLRCDNYTNLTKCTVRI